MSRVADGIESIGTRGSEMTKRRVIFSQLYKLAQGSSHARRVLLEELIGVVPANNAVLRTLRLTMSDLTERIKTRQAEHDKALSAHLTTIRSASYDAELHRLGAEVEESTARWKQAEAEFLRVDERVTQHHELAAEFRARREEIDAEQAAAAEVQRQLAAVDSEMQRVREKRTVSMIGEAIYEPSAATAAGGLDADRIMKAGGSGLGGAALLMGAVWFILRSPRRVRPSERS